MTHAQILTSLAAQDIQVVTTMEVEVELVGSSAAISPQLTGVLAQIIAAILQCRTH
jgi:hypothetical protein